jgi:hypothetical protein
MTAFGLRGCQFGLNDVEELLDVKEFRCGVNRR